MLTTPAPMTIGTHGVGAVGVGQGSGMETAPANAVSAVNQTAPTPHGPAKTALTGIVEGAQKNKAAIVIVAIILRSFIRRPQPTFPMLAG